MIAKCIIQHDLPFAYVEYERVRSIWKYLNEDVKFISRNTSAADVYKFYENEAENLKRELVNLPGRISLTSDLWSAITQEGYMCLTAHYIDKNWKLNNKILAFCAVPSPHTDNATNNDTMQEMVKNQLMLRNDLLCGGEYFHVRCAAHVLNVIVQDGLAVIGDSLDQIRESIKYVQRSERREILFAKCVESVGIKHKAGLLLDVKTIWNSTYKMLDRALKYRAAFANLKVPHIQLPTCTSCMQVWKINNWLTVNEFSDDEVIRIMIVPMKEKFDKYWEEVSDIFAMTTVLDPRLKLTLANYCFGKLDKSSCQQKIEQLKSKLPTLFESYENKSVFASHSTKTHETDYQRDDNEGKRGSFSNYDVFGFEVSSSSCFKNCRFCFFRNYRFSRSGLMSKILVLKKLQDFLAFRKETVVASGKTSLQMYLDESAIDMKNFESLDILKYWKDNSQRYGELASMACDLLSIPITTVASESSFSIGTRVLSKYRSCLLPKNVQTLIYSRNWLKGFEAYENEEEKELIGEDEALPYFQSIVDDEETA
ncbi:PREDICTED: zinc finger BED domain-containing protein RICESLEEPER 4-like [Camelina sativa]|uniref:Zinc finger BED domain-containing protein RICESLEEPER 4-like n=1 Tax=Camelina sativa TaxID=90675 RepID=A0ABM0ZC20_CAMSA|nr:PREDICTED: zinc finger BED domain-containing protein RICESLEEPER 4-like [Camelina sativa]